MSRDKGFLLSTMDEIYIFGKLYTHQHQRDQRYPYLSANQARIGKAPSMDLPLHLDCRAV